MASPKNQHIITGVLVVLAISGWTVAWKRGGAGDGEAEKPRGNAAESGMKRQRSESRGDSPVNYIKDESTARMLASFAEIANAAVPGEVNEKLIHACRGALMDSDVSRRERNLAMLLELMRSEDGPAMHDLFIDLHKEGRLFAGYKNFAMRWGALDAPAAIAYLSKAAKDAAGDESGDRTIAMPREDFVALARGWGKSDPNAAFKWLDENPELALAFGGRPAVMEGWMKQDVEGALGWLKANGSKLDNRERMECTRIALQEQIVAAKTDYRVAADWLAALPDDEQFAPAAHMAWEANAWTFGELPAEKAAEAWAKVGSEPWMNFGQFANFCGTVSHNRFSEGVGMDGFLDALGKNWPEDRVNSQFENWARQSPKVTLKWLESAPDTAFTKSAIRGAIKGLETSNPEAAAVLAGKLAE